MRRGVDCRIRHTHPRIIIRLQSIRHGHATEELINDWVQTTCLQVPHVRGLKWFILCGCSMEMMNGCEAPVARREKHRRYCSWLNGSWINYTYICIVQMTLRQAQNTTVPSHRPESGIRGCDDGDDRRGYLSYLQSTSAMTRE